MSANVINPDATKEEFYDGIDCSLIRNIPFKNRCEFVMEVDNCADHAGLLSYLDLAYCQIRVSSPETEKAIIPLMILFLLLCFYVLGMVADSRLCPALQMLSKVMKMSEVLAGVTLVAFGNCAPDFFSSFFSAQDPNRQVYSDLYASAMLVTSIIPGLIIVISPFRLHAASILRDASFILLGIIFINFCIREHGIIDTIQATILIVVYVVYIIIVILDQYFLKIATKRGSEAVEVDTSQRRGTEHQRAYEEGGSKNARLCKDFIQGILPIDKEEWSEASKMEKAIAVIKVPINFLINITIPNTDYEAPKHGWCKLLNCLQLVWMPLIMVFLIIPDDWSPYYCAAGCAVLTVPFAIAVFIVTRVDTAPKYHWVFAVYSAVGATVAISIVAEEVCELIYMLGLIIGMSSSFLGATVLAWGNSIGDMVANLMLAHQGFQVMGFAACFGAPIFNIFFTMGVTLLILAIDRNGEYEVKKGVFGETCNIFMIINSVITLIWMTLLDFNARRMIGILCIFMYWFFFVFTILTEIHIIDSFNSVQTDHLN